MASASLSHSLTEKLSHTPCSTSPSPKFPLLLFHFLPSLRFLFSRSNFLHRRSLISLQFFLPPIPPWGFRCLVELRGSGIMKGWRMGWTSRYWEYKYKQHRSDHAPPNLPLLPRFRFLFLFLFLLVLGRR